MGASMVAKYVASAISYPHEVLRSRMQDSRVNGKGRRLKLFELIRHIAKTEGVLSLWSGFQVNCVRIVPATISTFLSYEYLTRYLEGR
jgi:solute carrier family 25 (mitochondrial folate transporter), member 32